MARKIQLHTNRVYRKTNLSRERGTSIPEFAIGVMVGLPILIAVIFTALECGTYFSIKANLDVASRQAGRQLAIAYGKDPSIAKNNDQDSSPAIAGIYNACKIANYVNDRHQFSNPLFVSGNPGTVTVVVTYPLNGKYSLPIFPNPDPLHLAKKLHPYAAATFAL
jgi:Flp pilus assembly protein TadG